MNIALHRFKILMEVISSNLFYTLRQGFLFYLSLVFCFKVFKQLCNGLGNMQPAILSKFIQINIIYRSNIKGDNLRKNQPAYNR